MAYTTIKKPSDYFETTTYAGGTTAITSLDFSPDWVWAKKTTGAENHGIFDSVRGATKTINSNTADAESTRSGALTSFDSNGWSMGGADGIISAPGSDYVGWAWRGSDSSPVSNTDGSISSTVSVNTTSGFSIVKYTGTGANATVGHGLGVAPDVMIIKAYQGGQQWASYWSPLGATQVMRFNTTNVTSTSSTRWNNTAPTSTVFSVGSEYEVNTPSENMIAYCFTSKQGFSKIGSYTGNGNADGTFVYTGFKPAFIITKPTGNISSWNISDVKRSTYNDGSLERLKSNTNDAETSTSNFDILSNGFKLRTTDNDYNPSGGNVIYMAFAEEPLVGDNPATAR